MVLRAVGWLSCVTAAFVVLVASCHAAQDGEHWPAEVLSMKCPDKGTHVLWHETDTEKFKVKFVDGVVEGRWRFKKIWTPGLSSHPEPAVTLSSGSPYGVISANDGRQIAVIKPVEPPPATKPVVREQQPRSTSGEPTRRQLTAAEQAEVKTLVADLKKLEAEEAKLANTEYRPYSVSTKPRYDRSTMSSKDWYANNQYYEHENYYNPVKVIDYGSGAPTKRELERLSHLRWDISATKARLHELLYGR